MTRNYRLRDRDLASLRSLVPTFDGGLDIADPHEREAARQRCIAAENRIASELRIDGTYLRQIVAGLAPDTLIRTRVINFLIRSGLAGGHVGDLGDPHRPEIGDGGMPVQYMARAR